jgi:hypothetical protein
MTTTISSPVRQENARSASDRMGGAGERNAPTRAIPCPVFVLRTFTHSATSAPELSMMFYRVRWRCTSDSTSREAVKGAGRGKVRKVRREDKVSETRTAERKRGAPW